MSKTDFFFIIIVQLAVKTHKLKEAQDAAATLQFHSCGDHPHVQCPSRIGNLQVAMGLEGDDAKYHYFCVSFSFLQSIL